VSCSEHPCSTGELLLSASIGAGMTTITLNLPLCFALAAPASAQKTLQHNRLDELLVYV
jgi:hypothetical protein